MKERKLRRNSSDKKKRKVSKGHFEDTSDLSDLLSMDNEEEYTILETLDIDAVNIKDWTVFSIEFIIYSNF